MAKRREELIIFVAMTAVTEEKIASQQYQC
jgi:hypothetical protein